MTEQRPRLERDRLYRPEEVAALLGVEVGTVRRWIRRGALPAKKIGHLWFVSGEDLAPKPGPDKSKSE